MVRTPPVRVKEEGKTAPKASYHHGNLRNALLEAALALIGEGAVQTLSLREVARRAGVSYGAPYHHFADKSALLAAVACQGFEALVAHFEHVAQRKAALGAHMQAMAEAYVAFAVAHPAHYRVMFLPEIKASPGADAQALHAVSNRAFAMLLERVADARPHASSAHHRTLAVTVWAALHGLALLAIDGALEGKLPSPQQGVREACRYIVGMAA